MRILLQNSLFYPNLAGGAENSTLLLARELSARGHEVHVLTSDGRPGDGAAALASYPVDGLGGRVHHAPSAGSLPLLSGEKSSPGLVARARHHLQNIHDRAWRRRTAELLAELAPEVMHTNNLVGLTTAVWRAAKGARVPLVHTVRDFHLLCPRTTLLRSDGTVCERRPLACVALSKAKLRHSHHVDVVTSPTRFNLDRHAAAGAFPRARQEIVPNACEELPDEVPDRRGRDRVRVLYLGTVAAHKGVPELLGAMELVLADPVLDHVDLEIAGAGDLVSEVEAFAARYAPRCRYLGVIRGEAKRRALAEADLAVVPSTCLDNFPRVILDAFSHALPVVGSDRGGIPEVVRDGEDGLITAPEPAALARAIGELARDDARRRALGEAGRERAAGFTLGMQVSRFETIYASLAGASASG